MPQFTPEFEGLLQLIVYLECKIDAVTELLQERGISLSTEEIVSKTHRIHAVQGYPKRYRIMSMMKDGKFDFT
jgi:DNA-binding transcriptional regulator LsrR (DeoR family)